MMRQRKFGIACLGTIAWLGGLAYFAAAPGELQLQPTVTAAEPKFRKVSDEQPQPGRLTRAKSKVEQLLDGIRPGPKVVGREPEQRTEVMQTSASSLSIASNEQPELSNPFPVPAELQHVELLRQTPEQAHAKSWGCIECHKGSHDPHMKSSLSIGCTDCHGGNAQTRDKNAAHIHPRFPDAWCSTGNPVRSYTLLNHESPEFTRFVNPGDLRIAHLSCGTTGCHPTETLQVKKGMMTHGCMLWGAALYNNGAVNHKQSRYGESYSMYGTPQRVQTVPVPTRFEQDFKGILPFLEPLPRYQVTHPGNTLRVFERGGRGIVEIGNPDRLEESGRPRVRLSDRGFGTINRTDPVFIGLQKTRLLDPTLNFMGTNDHAGDYRSSGCTACHMIYANDRSPVHSGPYAKYGNRGLAAAQTDDFVVSIDPTIPKDEPGHPIAHRFTSAIPTSQCTICHMHPGTTVMQSYLGYMWSDQDTDSHLFYPEEPKRLTAEQFDRAQSSNPNDIDAKTRFVDPEELANATDLNPYLKHQLADFHGHGWTFRAVYKKDREGRLLDHNGNDLGEANYEQKKKGIEYPVHAKELYRDINWRERGAIDRVLAAEEQLRKQREGTTVHMLDIHLEKGMHCVDCHFSQDNHGDGKLYGEVRAAIEITCTDCHGTVTEYAPLITSGPAAEGNKWKGMITERKPGTEQAKAGRNLSALRTPFGKRRFEKLPDGTYVQNSMVEPDLSWRMTQVRDTLEPSHPDYNALSALSKTVRFELKGDKYEFAWGDIPKGADGKPDDHKCAHAIHSMNCITCHSAWNPSCFGCHLPQKANMKKPDLHNEGDLSRNYTAYCFQTLRDDVYMIAKDGNATGNRTNPVRSACAVHVSSYNSQRESIYYQQQTISGNGMSGIAFSTNVPHTVRGKGETKMCTDCHLSSEDDNNAIMAQLLMQGTNYTNFIGRFAWVAAGEHGVWSPIVQERDEPQAVVGSTLHAAAYPEEYKKHVEHGYQLQHAHEHPGNDISDNVFHPGMKTEVLSLQHRGEFLYAACGAAGFRIYDIAFTDSKAFSERYTTAPVSPLGQKYYIRTKYCTDVATPSTIAPDPTRNGMRADPNNHNFEAPVPLMYAFLYVTDLHEGLICVGAGSLLFGDPNKRFIKKDVVFNPNGILCGARAITIFGKYAYICCDAGIVIVDISNPLEPRVVNIMREGEAVHHAHNIEFQFRYGFVVDHHGVQIFDVTQPEQPVPISHVDLEDAHNIYVARTYAYVSGGHQGLVILDVKNPKEPKIDQIFNANGCISDLHDVKLGINYASQFAYLADGHNGMHIVQLTSPQTPGNDGFSPRPTPQLIASFKIPHGGHALAIAEGVDRDRAVDEAGNQIAVFGRIGARPFNLAEQQQLYLAPGTGNAPGQAPPAPWTVADPQRDFAIPKPRDREIKLHEQVEKWYGPSRLRK